MAVLRNEIRERLAEMIVKGKFAPLWRLPTIRSLAEGFGTSIGTVQKAINDLKREGFVSATHGKCIEVNRAKALRAGAGSRAVALVSLYPDLSRERGRFPSALVSSLEDGLSKHGYKLMQVPIVEASELDFLSKIRSADVCGIVLLEINDTHLIGEMMKLRLPIVSLDFNAVGIGVHSVVFSNTLGSFGATMDMIGKGHRLITAVVPSSRRRIGENLFEDSAEQERILGYELAMRYSGLAPDVVRMSHDPGMISQGVMRMFARRPCPTALFVQKNSQAAFICSELFKLGYRIPEDVSMSGFDIDRVVCAPGLKFSSVRTNPERMGSKGAEAMLSLVKGGAGEPSRTTIETDFVEGDSVFMLSDKICGPGNGGKMKKKRSRA